ncbi:two pore domain potassium channel family protein, partial [Thioclava sp. BHET1]
MQMLIEITLGSVLMLATIVIAGGSFWAMERLYRRNAAWFLREPHLPRLMLALCIAAVWSLWLVTAGVWIWALTFYALHVFATLEACVYFALVAFTTLGFGDLLLPQEWRLLGGMA